MKQSLNEVKKLQKIAGLITESEYLREYEKTPIYDKNGNEIGYRDDENNTHYYAKKSFGKEEPFGSKVTPAQPMSDEEKQTINFITKALIKKGLLKAVEADSGKMYGSAFVKSNLPVGTSYKIPGIIDQIAQDNNLSGRAVEMYKKQFGSF